MKRPFVSVIIPTFNRATQLQRAIESVLAQSFTDFEVLIVDDGSKDNTEQMVKQFTDNRIRYFYKHNEERSIARNYGIKMATGNYVVFLDSDDLYLKEHLQTGFKLIHASQFPEIAITGFEIVRESDKAILFQSNYSEQLSNKLIEDNLVVLNTVFISRNILDDNLLFIESPRAILSEDWCFFLRLAARFPIYHDNTITCQVLEHQSRSLNRLEAEKVEHAINLVIHRLETDPAVLEFYPKFNRFKANQFCFIGLHYGIEGKRKQALSNCLNAISCYWPVIIKPRFLAIIKKIILPIR
jgi:glycosyltransferase involved in cell wall biosynthesis